MNSLAKYYSLDVIKAKLEDIDKNFYTKYYGQNWPFCSISFVYHNEITGGIFKVSSGEDIYNNIE